jgi:hypothetical protein
MFAALAEAGTGVLLLAYPPIVVRLLFDAEIIGAGVIVSRIAGIALVGLGVACWPNGSMRPSLHGMMTYGILAALFLIYVGVRGEGVGVLLWPAVAAHVVLIVLLLYARFKEGTRTVGGLGA